MKHKTDALEGALLDAAVALVEADRLPDFWRDPEDGSCWVVAGKIEWAPSRRWDQAGPILQRERIALQYYRSRMDGAYWAAKPHDENGCELPHPDPELHKRFGNGWCPAMATGPTPLIAAMRAYVKAKLGDEVEIP